MHGKRSCKTAWRFSKTDHNHIALLIDFIIDLQTLSLATIRDCVPAFYHKNRNWGSEATFFTKSEAEESSMKRTGGRRPQGTLYLWKSLKSDHNRNTNSSMQPETVLPLSFPCSESYTGNFTILLYAIKFEFIAIIV